MRIEDLDGPRIKPGSVESVLAILDWLGLAWSGETMIQSMDLEPYRKAMRALASDRLVYSCDLTRREIEEAASAPHSPHSPNTAATSSSEQTPYPACLRPKSLPDRFDSGSENSNWRIVVSDEPIAYRDDFAGEQEFRLQLTCGDFVVWTKRGQPSYQLAVVVDDAGQGVTDIVRGDDLLESAARQLHLINVLALAPTPRYVHLPLVVGSDGRRLAKRHGDTRIETYREMGVPVERIVGLIAYWSGVQASRKPMSTDEFTAGFRLDLVPHEPVVCTADDHAWLLGERT
jgi:glutamyl-tRNA synthetase